MTSQSLLEVTSRHGGVVRVWRATARAILLYLRGDRSREGVWACTYLVGNAPPVVND